jgi:hypothetical protein
MTTCDAVKGGWNAEGRIVNSSHRSRDYRITVLFTSPDATVIGVGSTTVHVATGATGDWAIRERLVAASPTLCVLSGVA